MKERKPRQAELWLGPDWFNPVRPELMAAYKENAKRLEAGSPNITDHLCLNGSLCPNRKK